MARMTIADLTHQERTVLAGCIARLFRSGEFADEKAERINSIRDQLGFHELDEHLERFNEQARNDRDLLTIASELERPDARSFMYETLKALSFSDGYQNEAEESFLSQLHQIWFAR